MKKGAPGCSGYVGEFCGDYFINHDKDPYETTSIMESNKVFFVAHVKMIEITLLGGSSQLGCVVNNHGDRNSPK